MKPSVKKYNEALKHHQAGRLAEAERLYREILAEDGTHADALHMLAAIAVAAGNPESAVELLKIAISICGNEALYHFNLGCALQGLMRYQEAAEAHATAITLQPDYADAHNNLGCALRDLGLFDKAAQCFEVALHYKSHFPEARNNLGTMLARLNRLDQAIAEYQTVIRLHPSFVEAYFNLGQVLQILGRFEEAAARYGDAVRLQPDHAEAAALRINCLQNACAWRDLERLQTALLSGNGRYPPGIALSLDSTAEQQLAVARKWSAAYLKFDAVPKRPRAAGEKIRIGYLSSDFCNHATGYLIVELIERHDRERFEIFGYSYGPDDGTPIRRRLVKAFDHFVELGSLPEIPAAKRIHQDGIDILVDLKGYTVGARTELVVWRPAPVQVNFLGYPGTMGASFIDYIIADPICIPEGEDQFFSEKVIRLEGCYQPNDSRREISTEMPPTRALCGLPEQGLVFCCFNNSYKITPPVFAIWMRLLAKVPDSVLWLLDGGEEAKANLRREAEAAGIAVDRLHFAPRLSPQLHLARHEMADLCLDTLPVTAHTTASDALWMGVPLVTCLGKSFVGRVPASLLTAVGMEELITSSLEEYEALALALATDPARLAALKEKLAANRATASLFDGERFARKIEAVYERIAP